MKRLLKMFASLAVCLFLVVPAWAQTLDGADVLTNLHVAYRSVKYPTASYFNSSYQLLPYESAADSTGKVYHYIMSSTRPYGAVETGQLNPYWGPSNARYQTSAIDVRGYKTASVQIFSSSFGFSSIPASVPLIINASGPAGTFVSFYGSCYPAAITVSTVTTEFNAATSNGESLVYHTSRVLLNNFIQLPLSLNGANSVDAFLRDNTNNLYLQGSTVSDATPVSIAGFPRAVTTITQNGIATIDLGGGISNLVLMVSKSINRTTDHIILRVDR